MIIDELFEDRILSCLFRSKDFCTVAGQHLKPSYFENPVKHNLAKMAIDFYTAYRSVITEFGIVEETKALVKGKVIKPDDVGHYAREIVRLKKVDGAVDQARAAVAKAVPLPTGYSYDWGGEYKEYLAARSQLDVILPLTVVLILGILFALYGNLKFPLIIMFSVLVTVPVGGLLALKLTHTNFSVSSGFGFIALMGVSVQTSVILYSFINKLRLEGKDIGIATFEASLLRLRASKNTTRPN